MTKTTTIAVPVEAIAETFKAFSWHHGKPEHYHPLQTAALDIGKGIVTILEIIELGLLDDESERPPMFDCNYRANLMRMAITSASLLAEMASMEIQSENNRVRKEGK
ncbi:hypothetical protein ACXX82_06465 [Glaciimonas sp. GNP009]